MTGLKSKELNVAKERKYEVNLFGEKIPVKKRTAELSVTHNFICFYFDNDADWNWAKKEFELEQVSSIEGKPEGVRIGRVINGKKLIKKFH